MYVCVWVWVFVKYRTFTNLLKIMDQQRGRLIVFEGIDRSGKTTQAKLLLDALVSMGIRAEARKFPDRNTPSGMVIDQYLRNTTTKDLDDCAIHLLYSANRWEAKQEMERALNSGITLIVDRYAYSGVAYSTAKGLDMEWCKGPDRGLLKPDFVLYLYLDALEAETRGDYGMERYERVEFQSLVAEAYEKMHDSSSWVMVNAVYSQEDICHDIRKHVLVKMMEKSGPLQKLFL